MEVLRVDVIKNLRDGDVLWVHVAGQPEPEELDAMYDSISALVEANVTIFVTPGDVIERIRVLPLIELLQLREVIDEAIRLQVEARADDPTT